MNPGEQQEQRRRPGRRPPSTKGPRPGIPQEPRDGYTAVGRVLRPHGLRGEVRVQAFAEGAPNLQRGRRVWMGDRELTIVRARPDREAWILQFAEMKDRTDAEQYYEVLLEAPDSQVRRTDSESYFVHELIGLRVVTDDGRELGRVVEVLQTGANDVYVVRGERGEVLIPAVGDVVKQIDTRESFMSITPLPGLLDESE
ncbi:MAG TPA: ribosome maturation factor RimM [Tepidiformaceae bacterium]